jgi:hypothetical protein
VKRGTTEPAQISVYTEDGGDDEADQRRDHGGALAPLLWMAAGRPVSSCIRST